MPETDAICSAEIEVEARQLSAEVSGKTVQCLRPKDHRPPHKGVITWDAPVSTTPTTGDDAGALFWAGLGHAPGDGCPVEPPPGVLGAPWALVHRSPERTERAEVAGP